MANQIILSVDKKRLSVAPGANVTLAVKVQNLTTLLDQVAVQADGVDAAWVQVIPPYLPVFAQGEATARVVIQPPRAPAHAVAGRYPVLLRGKSQEFPGQESEESTELEVQLVGDYRFWLEKETRDGREAVLPVKVQNDANAPLRLQFKASDDNSALWFKFDPFQVDVPPGGVSSAMLTLRPKNAAAGERIVIYSLTAQGEYLPKDGTLVAAPQHKISGEYKQGAPARLNISIHPLQVQGREGGAFSIRIGNPGAAPTTVHLAGVAEDSDLAFNFEPAQVTLSPQSETTVSLSVRPTTSHIQERSHRHSFRVTARPIDGEAEDVSSEATFVRMAAAPAPKPTPFPWAILVGAISLVCLAAMLLMLYIAPNLLR